MSEIKWIKITTDIFDDEKIKIIDRYPARDEILVIWFKLLALAGKVNQNGLLFMSNRIPYTPEMLAAVFNREENIIKLALKTFQQFGMISVEDNEVIAITNWEKHQNIDGMDKIREQNRKRVAAHRQKQKQLLLTTENVTLHNVSEHYEETLGNAIEEDKEKDKDKELEKEINNTGEQGPPIGELAEQLYSLYPLKKGKAQALKALPKLINKYGYEQIEFCIERYKDEVTKTGCYIKHASTFFNSGYVDYLDENYSGPQIQPAKGKVNRIDEVKERLQSDTVAKFMARGE